MDEYIRDITKIKMMPVIVARFKDIRISLFQSDIFNTKKVKKALKKTYIIKTNISLLNQDVDKFSRVLKALKGLPR